MYNPPMTHEELTDCQKGCMTIVVLVLLTAFAWHNWPTEARAEAYAQREQARRANWAIRKGMTVYMKLDGRKALVVDDDFGFNGDLQDGDFDIQVRMPNNHKTLFNNDEYVDIVVKANEVSLTPP